MFYEVQIYIRYQYIMREQVWSPSSRDMREMKDKNRYQMKSSRQCRGLKKLVDDEGWGEDVAQIERCSS